MIDSQSGTQTPSPHSKRIPIQERSIRVGDVIVVNAYRVNRTLLTQRFAEGSYQVYETKHFFLFTRMEEPMTILVHWFAPEEIDADIGTYIMQELKPLGFVPSAERFGHVIGAMICSLAPTDPQHALHLYAINTLNLYHHLLNTSEPHVFSHSNMGAFVAWYRRICQMFLGESFLDAGCLFGFLTMLVAERIPTLKRVVGLDIQAENFPIMRAIIEEKHLDNVQFVQADLLHDDVRSFEPFDTVVALGVIEHFTEIEMYDVLRNLLAITAQRLILTVPYEITPEKIYGHQQMFNRMKLETIGSWCTQHWKGHAHYLYEDCEGGLLVVERTLVRKPDYNEE